MEDILNKLLSLSTNLVIKIIIAILIILIGFKIVKIIENYLKKENRLKHIDKSIKTFLISFITIGLKVLLFIFAIHELGVPMASVITILGSCALAIGLALQGGLSNIAGGVMLLLFKPFKVGDYISVDNKEGTVKSISLFYTTIETLNNITHQLPNGVLSNSNITNYTYKNIRRCDIDFSVSYNSDIKKVKKVIENLINDADYVLKDKENSVILKRMDSSELIFTLRIWILSTQYYETLYYFNEKIKEELDKNNIVIPYPQLDVHLDK